MGNDEGMVVHMEKERMGCFGREWEEKGWRLDISKYFEYRGNRIEGLEGGRGYGAFPWVIFMKFWMSSIEEFLEGSWVGSSEKLRFSCEEEKMG